MKYLMLLILVLPCYKIIATEQIQDAIYVDRKKFYIEEQPLWGYPKYKSVLEKIGPGLSTASRRGYQAFWRVSNDKLYLIYINYNPGDGNGSTIIPEELLAERESKEFASWYNGKVTIRTSGITYLSKSVEGVNGEKFDAVVYKIAKGKVLSRDVEKIEHVW